MERKEMKLKMKLVQIIENRQEEVQSTTFIYKPTLEDYQKNVSLKVNAADPYAMLGSIGLPQSIGDTVIISFSQREEQQSLDKINKEFREKIEKKESRRKKR